MYNGGGQALDRPHTANPWCCSLTAKDTRLKHNATSRIDRLICKDAPLPLNTKSNLNRERNFHEISKKYCKSEKEVRKENFLTVQSPIRSSGCSEESESDTESIQDQPPLMYFYAQDKNKDEETAQNEEKTLHMKKQKEVTTKVSLEKIEKLKKEEAEELKDEFLGQLVGALVDKKQNSHNKLSINIGGMSKNQLDYLKRKIKKTLDHIKLTHDSTKLTLDSTNLQTENTTTKSISPVTSIKHISPCFHNTESKKLFPQEMTKRKKKLPNPSSSHDLVCTFHHKKRKKCLKLRNMKKTRFPLNSSFNNKISKSITDESNDQKNALKFLIESLQEKLLSTQDEKKCNRRHAKKHSAKTFRDNGSDTINLKESNTHVYKSISPKKPKNIKLSSSKRKLLYDQLTSWNLRNKYLAEELKCSFANYEKFVKNNFHILFSNSLLKFSQREMMSPQATDEHSDDRKAIPNRKLLNKKDHENEIAELCGNLLKTLNEEKNALLSWTENSEMPSQLSIGPQNSFIDSSQENTQKYIKGYKIGRNPAIKIPFPRKKHLKKSLANKPLLKRKTLRAPKTIKSSTSHGQKYRKKY